MKTNEERIKHIRRIVSELCNVHSDEIILSNQLSMTEGFSNNKIVSSEKTTQHIYKMHGYSHIGGLRDLTQYVDVMDAPYSKKTAIRDIPRIEDFMMLIIEDNILTFHNSGQRQSSKCVTLYKLPDFKQYWEDTEEVDIKRWVNWLKDHE